jgi:hypothetical protein
MATTERKTFQTLTKFEYNGIAFTLHHLIIAKSLKFQGEMFHDLEKKLNELNVDILSFEKVNFEIEKLELSGNDLQFVEEMIRSMPEWVPSKEGVATNTLQHKKIIDLSDQLNALFVNIAITASTLLEALINLYLSIKCLESGNQEVFEILERARFDQKWRVGPKIFLEGYELLCSSSPGQDLKELIKIRNALVHYKPQVDNKLDNRGLKGSDFDIESYSEKARKINIFLELPGKLLRHLYRHNESSGLISRLSDSLALSDAEKENILAS